MHKLGFQLYTHTLLFCNTLPKQNEIFCLVSVLLTSGFFGSAGFDGAVSGLAIRLWRTNCLVTAGTGESSPYTEQLLEQCWLETTGVTKRATNFYFSKPGSRFICTFVPTQIDLPARME